MDSLWDLYSKREKEIFLDKSNKELTAQEFFDKFCNEFTEVEMLEIYGRLKSVETQHKIQEMLSGESERLGDIYYLRKAGNWAGCDFYRSIVREDEREYLEKYKYENIDEE